MVITARYAGLCSRCGGEIRPGDEIEWTRGGPSRHVACPEPATAGAQLFSSVQGGVRRPAGVNRKADICDTCGNGLAPGEGRLERCVADTGCMQHFDFDGWHVYCLDEVACRARLEAREAEERQRLERSRQLSELAREVEATVPAVEARPPKGRVYAPDGNRYTPAYYERQWVVADDGTVVWVHPRPALAYEDGYHQVYYILPEQLATRARELGLLP